MREVIEKKVVPCPLGCDELTPQSSFCPELGVCGHRWVYLWHFTLQVQQIYSVLVASNSVDNLIDVNKSLLIITSYSRDLSSLDICEMCGYGDGGGLAFREMGQVKAIKWGRWVYMKYSKGDKMKLSTGP